MHLYHFSMSHIISLCRTPQNPLRLIIGSGDGNTNTATNTATITRTTIVGGETDESHHTKLVFIEADHSEAGRESFAPPSSTFSSSSAPSVSATVSSNTTVMTSARASVSLVRPSRVIASLFPRAASTATAVSTALTDPVDAPLLAPTTASAPTSASASASPAASLAASSVPAPVSLRASRNTGSRKVSLPSSSPTASASASSSSSNFLPLSSPLAWAPPTPRAQQSHDPPSPLAVVKLRTAALRKAREALRKDEEAAAAAITANLPSTSVGAGSILQPQTVSQRGLERGEEQESADTAYDHDVGVTTGTGQGIR